MKEYVNRLAGPTWRAFAIASLAFVVASAVGGLLSLAMAAIFDVQFPYPHQHGPEALFGGSLVLAMIVGFCFFSGVMLHRKDFAYSRYRLIAEVSAILFIQLGIWIAFHRSIFGGSLSTQLLETWWHLFLPQLGAFPVLAFLMGRGRVASTLSPNRRNLGSTDAPSVAPNLTTRIPKR